jgi:hypothetical protein
MANVYYLAIRRLTRVIASMKRVDEMGAVLDILFDPSEQSLQTAQNCVPGLGDQIEVLHMMHPDQGRHHISNLQNQGPGYLDLGPSFSLSHGKIFQKNNRS